MSRLKTDAIRNTSASADALTFDTSGNTTIEGNATVDGTSTLTGNVTCSGQLKTAGIRNASASSDAITFATDGTCTAKITNNLSNRNLVINGAMQVSQRGTSSSTDGYQTVDRWNWDKSNTDQAATLVEKTTNTPDGFKNSLKVDCTTAESTLDADETGILRYRIEGQDLQHLKTGTANAEPMTLSFWAKTNAANSGDTYSVCIIEGDISGNDRCQYRTFAPTSTWTRYTMSFVGQTNNIIRNDSDYGMSIHYVLAAGSSQVTSANTTWSSNTGLKGVTSQSNFFDSTSNEFFITGVQLEVGDIATDFEHRRYGDELARCQRYYYTLNNDTSTTYWFKPLSSGTYRRCQINFPTTMRATPTISNATGVNNGTGGTPTGAQNVDIDHADFYWNVSDSLHLVKLATADFSAEI